MSVKTRLRRAARPVIGWATSVPPIARLAAGAIRRHPRLRGASLVGDAIFERLPHHGERIADFGGGARIPCDLAIEYERSVYSGREERIERLLLERLVQPNDTLIDAGANIGLFAVIGGRAVGPAGRVIAFEPVPATMRALRAGVAASRLDSVVTCHQVALGERSGEVVQLAGDVHNIMRVQAAEHDPATTAASITTSSITTSSITAVTATLDETLADQPLVHGLKLDVEGYELPVLLGAQRVIAESSPWILVEFNSDITGIRRLDEWDVHRHLRSLGYEAHLPFVVYHDDLRPLPDRWGNPAPYVNLLYWRALPAALAQRMPTTPQAPSPAAKARAALRRAVPPDVALAKLARVLVGIDRGRRRVWAGIHRRRVAPPATAEPVALLATIAHWRTGDDEARTTYLTQVVSGLLSIPADRATKVAVVVLSNDAGAAAADLAVALAADHPDVAVSTSHRPRQSVRAAAAQRSVVVQQWRPRPFRRHGFHLTWSHVPVLQAGLKSGGFTHLLYLEDDIAFDAALLEYWLVTRGPLAALGLLPGFVRYEKRDDDLVVVDQEAPVRTAGRLVAVPGARTGERYLNLDNPYQGCYLLDLTLAEQHLRFSPSRSSLLSRVRPWPLRERAATGPIFDDVPPGLFTRNVVPVREVDGEVQLQPQCLIEHLTGNYSTDATTRFGSLTVSQMFERPAPHTGGDEPPR